MHVNIIGINSPFLAIITTWHIVVILVVALILFGGKKLPEFAKGLAKSLRVFKDELHSVQRDLEQEPTPPAKENDVAIHNAPPPAPQEPKKQ
jgi:sec-independent protein translocase protein TatA